MTRVRSRRQSRRPWWLSLSAPGATLEGKGGHRGTEGGEGLCFLREEKVVVGRKNKEGPHFDVFVTIGSQARVRVTDFWCGANRDMSRARDQESNHLLPFH